MTLNMTTVKTLSDGAWQGDTPSNYASPLLIVQTTLVLCLCLSRFLAFLLKSLRQPKVIAEILLVAMAATYVEGQPQPPCIFIFGDSLSDPGNNNLLATSAKFNFFPYGIDFPSGPTGRATNGRTAADILSEFMGLPLIPPFATTVGLDVLKGVNYASSAAGILYETGKHLGDVISMDTQITNHGVTIDAITARLGSAEAAQKYLHKCLYYVNVGSNDYLNNYFMPDYPSRGMYNPNQFADLLMSSYSRQLRALHDTGAKKFASVSLGFVGCAPGVPIVVNSSINGCVEDVNAANTLFNGKLRGMVDQLNSEFSGDASFIFVNATAIYTLNPDYSGIKVRDTSCCQMMPLTGLCVVDVPPCEDRNEYVFWDGFHPTETVNTIFAKSAFNASNPDYTYPTDIARLVSSSR